MGKGVLLCLTLAYLMSPASADGKTLVLLDNVNIRDTHSIFFRSLAGNVNVMCSMLRVLFNAHGSSS